MDNHRLKDFCFAADENYWMPLQVCVASLLWSLRKSRDADIIVHVLDLGISDSTYADIESRWKSLVNRIKNNSGCISIQFDRHPIDKTRFDGLMLWNGSVATYARLLLPQLLPDVDWCVYSDCDVLFVESPVSLEAVIKDDVLLFGHKNPPWSDAIDGAWFRDNNLMFHHRTHICAGFIVMNLKGFRENCIAEKSFDFLGKYQKPASADQSALNCVCADSIRLLPSLWGITNGEIHEEAGGAIHYADGVPWKAPWNCTMLLGLNQRVSDLWRQFAVKVAGVDRRRVRPRFRAMIKVRIRAVIIWCLLLISKMAHFSAGRYENWPGKNITPKAIARYRNWLFDETE